MHTKILVTGGFGVLGRLFYAQLYKDYDIYLLDRARDQSERIIIDNAQNHWSLPNIPDDHYFECDILDYEKLRECLKDIDIVVHLAALLENQNPERIELVNMRGTENVLNACRENGIRKILYASSVMVMYYHRETPVINSIFTQTVGSHDIPKLKVEDAVPCDKDIINKYFAPNDVEGVYSYIGSKLKCESLVNDFVKENNDRSAVIMRLGWVNVMNNPYVEENPCGDESCVWMSQRIHHMSLASSKLVDIPAFIPRNRFTFAFNFYVRGHHSAGASSLIARFANNSTPDFTAQPKKHKHAKLGRNIVKITFSNDLPTCVAAFFVFDVTSENSFAQIQTIINFERSYKGIRVLVGNKSDLPNRAILYERALFYAQDLGVQYFEVCSREQRGVNFIFESIAESVFLSLASGATRSQRIVQVGDYPIIRYNLCEKLKRVASNPTKFFVDIIVQTM